VIEEAEEAKANGTDRNSVSRESPPAKEKQQQQYKKSQAQQKYCFSADLSSLRSFTHGNMMKGFYFYPLYNSKIKTSAYF
jgi:hypothetical protein